MLVSSPQNVLLIKINEMTWRRKNERGTIVRGRERERLKPNIAMLKQNEKYQIVDGINSGDLSGLFAALTVYRH